MDEWTNPVRIQFFFVMLSADVRNEEHMILNCGYTLEEIITVVWSGLVLV